MNDNFAYSNLRHFSFQHGGLDFDIYVHCTPSSSCQYSFHLMYTCTGIIKYRPITLKNLYFMLLF